MKRPLRTVPAHPCGEVRAKEAEVEEAKKRLGLTEPSEVEPLQECLARE